MPQVGYMRGSRLSPFQKAQGGSAPDAARPTADNAQQARRFHYLSGLTDNQMDSSKVAKVNFNPPCRERPNLPKTLDPSQQHLRSLPASSISFVKKLLDAKI